MSRDTLSIVFIIVVLVSLLDSILPNNQVEEYMATTIRCAYCHKQIHSFKECQLEPFAIWYYRLDTKSCFLCLRYNMRYVHKKCAEERRQSALMI